MTKRSTFRIAGVMLALSILLAAADRAREQKYQQAVDLLETKGDAKGALKLFEDAAKSPDRNLAARSLLYLGSCYEKLGQDGAQKAYDRIVREFGDQADVSAKAHVRLAALGKPAEGGVVARRIWASLPADNITFGSGVSLDGRYLAFMDYGNDSLNIMDTMTGEARQVVRKSENRSFNWVYISPDGKKLAYCASLRDEPYQLYTAGVDGSNVRRIGEGCPRGWSPDGKYVLAFTPGPPRIVMISVADGSSRTIVSGVRNAALSPDGRYVAFTGQPQGQDVPIFVAPANGGPKTMVADGRNKDVIWAADGIRLLFISDRRGGDDLWSIRVAAGKPDGPPELLKEHVDSLVGVNRDGDVYYGAPHVTSDIYAVDLDPPTGKLASRPKRITTRYINRAPAWSPDGESLAYYSQRGTRDWTQGGLSVIIRAMKTGEERTLPTRSPIFLTPTHPYWFPDGRSLFAQVFAGRLLQIDLANGADRQLLSSVELVPAPIGHRSAALAPDGRSVYYLARGEKSDETRLLTLDLDGRGEKELFRGRPGVPAVSPDRLRLAYVSVSDDGGWALFTGPIGGGQPTEVYGRKDASLGKVGRYPVWSKDGKHIFFNVGPSKGNASGEIWCVSAEGGEAQPLGIALGEIDDLDLHPGGRQLVFTSSEWRDEIWVVKNLTTEAKASR